MGHLFSVARHEATKAAARGGKAVSQIKPMRGRHNADDASSQPVPDSQTKRCPYCAEEILAEAVKCRFCNSMLGGQRFKGKPIIIALGGLALLLVVGLTACDRLTFKTLKSDGGGRIKLWPFHQAQITPDYTRWHGMDIGTTTGSYELRGGILTIHYPVQPGQMREYNFESKPTGYGDFGFVSIDHYSEPLGLMYVEGH